MERSRQISYLCRMGSCIASLKSMPSVMNLRIVDCEVISSKRIKYPTCREDDSCKCRNINAQFQFCNPKCFAEVAAVLTS